jgi:DNA-binding GntR family transcriptional regulator
MLPPEISKHVEELRAHFHSHGLLNADAAADDFARALHSMYLKSIAPGALPEIVEHFDRLRQIHRLDIPFEERRVLVKEHLAAASALPLGVVSMN